MTNIISNWYQKIINTFVDKDKSKKRTAYILMRIHQGNIRDDDFRRMLDAAFTSIKYQIFDKDKWELKLLVYLDGSSDKVTQLFFDGYDDWADINWKNADYSMIQGQLIKATSSHGSAYGSYILRTRFLELSTSYIKVQEETYEEVKENIAIFLDQDDIFNGRYALKNIMRKFKDDDKARVCIVDFVEYEGNVRKNDDGCTPHSKALKRLNSESPSNRIYCVDSMMWTKVFNARAMSLFLKSLADSFPNSSVKNSNCKESQIAKMFTDNDAYEDFLDHYVMLLNNVEVVATQAKTHRYNRHGESITRTPKSDDFIKKRVFYLSKFVQMYYAQLRNLNGINLKKNSEELMFDYLAYKIARIEDIIADYVKKYEDGDEKYEDIALNPSIDSFAEIVCNNIKELDHDAFERLQLYARKNFNAVASALSITAKIQRETGSYDKLRELRRVAYSKKTTSERKKVEKKIEEIISLLVEQKQTKKQYQEDTRVLKETVREWSFIEIVGISILTWIGFTIVITLILQLVDFFANSECYSMIKFLDYFSIKNLLKRFYDMVGEKTTIQVVGAIIAPAAAFLKNKFDKKSAESKKREVYNQEFNDLLRHLEANAKVLLEIALNIEKNKQKKCRPNSVHFINLEIPANSILLSNDPILNINSKSIDDMARVKVNIRNINNSAQELAKYSMSSEYEEKYMLAMINWELSRYFGYLANFRYYHEHGRFPTIEELDVYMDEQSVINRFRMLFIKEYNDEVTKEHEIPRLYLSEIKEKTNDYLNNYKTDRRVRRAVLLLNK